MESEVNGILVAAHELKAPLGLLRQLALSLDMVDERAERKKIQTQMVSISDKALKQVQDLTKIARLDDGLFEVEPVAIRAVCDEVTEELRYLFRFNHRNLEIDYRNRSRLVMANRELLKSVVYNFCLNAMHYSDEETRSELTLQDSGGKVRLLVRDFGPALPMDVWRSLKKGWVEKPTSIAMRPGSSGLGLYIASKFSQYMNANVGAVRHRDGTSFFVELPISKQVSLF
ncbi:HAMP domain-containing histidine kinase [Candidatus Saccharibacteria bacterium]|nr:HAMP domain-containing histidine kinase [Candidatus Saccharibacteria bacterium]